MNETKFWVIFGIPREFEPGAFVLDPPPCSDHNAEPPKNKGHLPQNSQPTVLYWDKPSAEAEAKRLAEAKPGKLFFVLEAMTCSRTSVVATVDLTGCSPAFDDPRCSDMPEEDGDPRCRCVCGHSIMAHASISDSGCTIHGCECKGFKPLMREELCLCQHPVGEHECLANAPSARCTIHGCKCENFRAS